MSSGNKINWFTQRVLVWLLKFSLYSFFLLFFTWALIDWAGHREREREEGGEWAEMKCDMALIERVRDARKSFRSINTLRLEAHSSNKRSLLTMS